MTGLICAVKRLGNFNNDGDSGHEHFNGFVVFFFFFSARLGSLFYGKDLHFSIQSTFSSGYLYQMASVQVWFGKRMEKLLNATRFAVSVNEDQERPPTFYWLPKLHKKP